MGKIKDQAKLILSIITIVFWLAATHICDYVFPDNDPQSVQFWWWLKSDFYVVIICMCYVMINKKGSNNKDIKFIEDFMIQFGLLFAVSNSIDRWFLDSRFFTWASYYPLIFIALVSYFNVKRLNKMAIKSSIEIKSRQENDT